MRDPIQPEEQHPYSPPRDAPPAAEEERLFPFEEDSPETMRSTYGAHEASVRTIGLYLYLLGAMGVFNLALILGSPRFFQELMSRFPPGGALPAEGVKIVMVFGGLLSAGFYSLLGFFLRRLQNWARCVVVIFSGFGVLGVRPSYLPSRAFVTGCTSVRPRHSISARSRSKCFAIFNKSHPRHRIFLAKPIGRDHAGIKIGSATTMT